MVELANAGAIHIRRDANGRHVGVIPPPGWDLSNPHKDDETFIKWMELAGHTRPGLERRAGIRF
ncbi:MAG: hypothetical protein V2B18_17080, partial [Pseudomonadota bacterium]